MSLLNQSSSLPIRVAVLDDYQNLSEPYIKHLSSDHNLSITVFISLKDPVLDRSNHAELITALQPFHIICTMRERTPLPKSLISQLLSLRLVLTTGMRNASLDVDACKEAGIVVAGTRPSPAGRQTTLPTPKDNTTQHTWALILGLANNIARDDLSMKRGSWQGKLPISANLSGRTFGCLGLGRLGTEVAKIAASAFGMHVVAWSTSLTQEVADVKAESMGLAPGTFKVASSKAALCEVADILSIHYVLSPRSQNIVGETELSLLKPSAILINTSRGPLVDEDALFSTLAEGRIRGAALDVFWTEPLPEDSRWRTTEWGTEGRSEVVMTPHTGFVSEDMMESWWVQTRENLERWLKGEEILNRLC